MKTVFEGAELRHEVTFKDADANFALPGKSRDGKRLMWPVSQRMLSQHMLFLGSIGTGKSNAIYLLLQRIRETLTPDDVMIIFDTKGDFHEEFYRKGDIVISNDNRACGSISIDYWNIFREIMADSRLEENTLEVCKTIFSQQLEKTNQPFFPNAAKDLLFALLVHLARNKAFIDKQNNFDLRQIINSFSVESMLTILRAHPDLRAMESYIKDPSSGQTLGVVSELQQAAREILIGNFAKPGNLSMRDIVKKKGGKVVFIEYDLSIGTMLTPIYRLLFDLAIKEALSRKNNEGNVYFVIDEFRLLPNLQHVDDGVNFGRSLGAKFILGVQNVEQIYNAYGKELGRSILSGFSTRVCFRLNDGETRSYVKELFGSNEKMITYHSKIGHKGIQEELRQASVVEDWDLSKLGLGEAIIGYAEHDPFVFGFQKYG